MKDQQTSICPGENGQLASLFLNNIALTVGFVLLLASAWAGLTAIVVLLGLALAAAALTKAWSSVCLRGVRCKRLLTEQRVFPGEETELSLRLVNRKLLPLPWVQVNDEVPAGFIRHLPSEPGVRAGFASLSQSTPMLWYSAATWKYRLLCDKRGYYPLGPLSVTSGDIFGFRPRTAYQPVDDYLLVYPRTYDLAELSISSLAHLGDATSEKRVFEDPSRAFGVRPYAPGDGLRRIHWKASARRQSLQVKVLEPTTDLKVALFLAIESFGPEEAANISSNDLEEGISVAASLATHLLERDFQTGLWTNSALADDGHPARVAAGCGVDQLSRILEVLAKVTDTTAYPFVDFFQNERMELPFGSTLAFVMGRVIGGTDVLLADLAAQGHRVLVYETRTRQETGKEIPGVSRRHVRLPAPRSETPIDARASDTPMAGVG